MTRHDSNPPDAEMDALDRELAGYFRSREAASATHAEAAALASLAEGRISEAEREALEGHLADCADCRRAVVEARRLASSISEAATTDGRRWLGRPWQWTAFAAAFAVLVAATLAFWFRSTPVDRDVDSLGDAQEVLAAFGLTDDPLQGARAETLRRAANALTGTWPRPDAFAEIEREAAAVRGTSNWRQPVIREPRWSVVDAGSMPAFRWRLPEGADEQEILLVDEAETLIATLTPPVDSDADLQSLDAAAFSIPWREGQTYAWKINARTDEAWNSSAFVPFHVASDSETRALDGELRTTDELLLQVVALAAAGRYDRALKRLRYVESERREEVARSLLDQLHLPPDDLEAELQRWRGTP